jgi:hypothetical protein
MKLNSDISNLLNDKKKIPGNRKTKKGLSSVAKSQQSAIKEYHAYFFSLFELAAFCIINGVQEKITIDILTGPAS